LRDSLELIINKTPKIISKNISFKRIKFFLEELNNSNGDINKINNCIKEFPQIIQNLLTLFEIEF